MINFRLQVFYTVAKRLNFTKAAAELFISQPAVTKHIKELEQEFKTTLFDRSGNKSIQLTASGEMLMRHAENIMAIYRDIQFDMNLLSKQHTGTLRIGASTTIAQYVIPPVLAEFHKKFKDVKIHLVSGNTEEIEQRLINKEIDCGIIEGIVRNPALKYESYLRDELVLVCASQNFELKKETIKPEELKNHPFLLREPGSGTLDVIAHALKKHAIKLADLQVEMQLGGTESIKSYLIHSKCLAFLSIHSILAELKNNQLRVVDVKNLTIERPFQFISQHGQRDSLSELFLRFAKNYNHNV